MKKREVAIWDMASHILENVSKGVLVTTKVGEKINSMTISWGTLGIEWGKPIFTTFVREHRFTRELLEESMEFTVNIPYGDFDKKILGVCGSKSGRDIDKVKELGLTPVKSEIVGAPGLKEFPLTLECKVIYKTLQNKDAILEDIKSECYPQDVDSFSPRANKDFHITFCGEIVKAYIIEE